eukprot:symbB.v1.2.030542.t1/scaffold3453.1/size56350/2
MLSAVPGFKGVHLFPGQILDFGQARSRCSSSTSWEHCCWLRALGQEDQSQMPGQFAWNWVESFASSGGGCS